MPTYEQLGMQEIDLAALGVNPNDYGTLREAIKCHSNVDGGTVEIDDHILHFFVYEGGLPDDRREKFLKAVRADVVKLCEQQARPPKRSTSQHHSSHESKHFVNTHGRR